MKQIFVILIIALLLTACIPQLQVTNIPHELYTEMAKTVAVQLTANALLTPSVTPTATPEPTATATATPEPSPTVPSPTPTWLYQDRGEVQVPILVYYNIADDMKDNPSYSADAVNNISPVHFEQQMTALRDNGYVTIPVSLLMNTMLFGGDIPSKPIIITFDVTSQGIYTKAFPVMQQLGFVGNIFVAYNEIGQQGMLTVSMIKEMMEAGWNVGSRGMNGYDLTAGFANISDEISGSRLKLGELLGTEITIFAYPYGRSDDIIFPRVSEWGYKAALGLTWYTNSKHSSQNIYYLARFEVLNGETLAQIFADLPWQPGSLPTDIPASGSEN